MKEQDRLTAVVQAVARAHIEAVKSAERGLKRLHADVAASTAGLEGDALAVAVNDAIVRYLMQDLDIYVNEVHRLLGIPESAHLLGKMN